MSKRSDDATIPSLYQLALRVEAEAKSSDESDN